MRSHDLALSGLWLAAVLRGTEAPDDLTARTPLRRVLDAAGDPVSGAVLAAAWRTAGYRSVVVAPAAPGDPGGVRGSQDVLGSVTQAGGALSVPGTGRILVRLDDGTADTWVSLSADVEPPPDPTDAARILRREMRTAAQELEALDLAGGRDAYEEARTSTRDRLPRGMDPERAALLETALRVDEALAVATRAAGGAVSAGALRARAAALSDLQGAARRAIAAAASTASSDA